MRLTNKKAQEEMVGFVVIVVLLIVIGLVFLAFSISKAPDSTAHQEAVMFDTMYSMLAYSTCETNARELVKDCYNEPSKQCDGKPVCDYVHDLFADILDKTLGKDLANSYVHGYILNISNSEQLVYEKKGITNGSYFASGIPIQAAGTDIWFNLRFYYGNKPETD